MIYATRKWTDNLDIGKQLITEMDERLPQPVRVQFSRARSWPLADYDVLYALIMLRESTLKSRIFWIGSNLPPWKSMTCFCRTCRPSRWMKHLEFEKTTHR